MKRCETQKRLTQIGMYLCNNPTPSARLPCRAAQTKDTDLKKAFTPLAEKLTSAENQIVSELIAVQGKPADIGGYYQPDNAKASAALRPSSTLNAALATL